MLVLIIPSLLVGAMLGAKATSWWHCSWRAHHADLGLRTRVFAKLNGLCLCERAYAGSPCHIDIKLAAKNQVIYQVTPVHGARGIRLQAMKTNYTWEDLGVHPDFRTAVFKALKQYQDNSAASLT